ncbi:unnamed protein product [Euphydryas editha]|uniref:Uncharacterized protein n=1 Tax=Euphydryas editha TaxID=104508 RepID=A0AAU9V4U8_EUPED|nr:unnamed protein product [Euphydryas editha]
MLARSDSHSVALGLLLLAAHLLRHSARARRPRAVLHRAAAVSVRCRCGAQVCEMLARSDSHSVALGLLLLAAHLLRHSARARRPRAVLHRAAAVSVRCRCGAQVCEMLARSDSHSVALGLLLLAAHLLRHSARARRPRAVLHRAAAVSVRCRCGAQVCEMLARSDSHSVALGLLLLAAHLLRHSARARRPRAVLHRAAAVSVRCRCGAQVCEMLARSDSHSVALGLLLLAAHLLRHSARARRPRAVLHRAAAVSVRCRCGAQVCEMLARSDSHSVALGLLLLAAHLLRHSARARADLAQFYIELLR